MSNEPVPRRTFLKLAVVTAAGAVLAESAAANAVSGSARLRFDRRKAADFGVKLGVASYSLRNFSRQQAIEMTKALRARYINLKSVHLPYDASPATIAAARQEIEAAGLPIVGAGRITL